MEKSFPVEKPSTSGSAPDMPVPKNMQNIREKRVDSGPSTVPQIPHQTVAGTVTTGQSVQAGKMRMRVELKLPEELKPCLAEDWELKTVDTLLAEYVTFVKSQWKADNKEYYVDELVYGIREYFNMMLGTQLLYQFEKPQYAEIHLAYPHILMSQVYGAPHLLRLFTQFGTVLTHSGLTRQSLMRVSSYLHDFLKYLIENSTSLFSASNYQVASAEYCCQAL
ncbi:Mortality factor 4-like protein 2 [Lemmus lemmus]